MTAIHKDYEIPVLGAAKTPSPLLDIRGDGVRLQSFVSDEERILVQINPETIQAIYNRDESPAHSTRDRRGHPGVVRQSGARLFRTIRGSSAQRSVYEPPVTDSIFAESRIARVMSVWFFVNGMMWPRPS